MLIDEKRLFVIFGLFLFFMPVIFAETNALDLTNSFPSVYLNQEKITIKMLSASDSSTTIEITDSSGNSESKEILEGNSEKLGNFQVFIITSDQTNTQQFANIKIQPLEIQKVSDGNEIYLWSYEVSKNIEFDDEIYTLELLGISDYSSVIKITKKEVSDTAEIYDNSTEGMVGLNIKLLSTSDGGHPNHHTSYALFSLNKIEEESSTNNEEITQNNTQEQINNLKKNVSDIQKQVENNTQEIIVLNQEVEENRNLIDKIINFLKEMFGFGK